MHEGLRALFIAQELASTFGAEHEMNNDVGEGLGHGVTLDFARECFAPTGWKDSTESFTRLSHDGLSALTAGRADLTRDAGRPARPRCDSLA